MSNSLEVVLAVVLSGKQDILQASTAVLCLPSVKYTLLFYYKGNLCCRFISLEFIQSNFEPTSIFSLYCLQGQHVPFLYYLLCQVVISCICPKTTPFQLLREPLGSTSAAPETVTWFRSHFGI
jgi:hypothetical protein